MDALIGSFAALLVVMGIMMAVASRATKRDTAILNEILAASEADLDSWSEVKISHALEHVETMIESDLWPSEPDELHTIAQRLEASLDRNPDRPGGR